MRHEEIAELLGAYALDAVDSNEAEIVATHVEGCPRCAAELAEYLETAGVLANVGGEAPGDLWDRISDQVRRTEGDLDAEVATPGRVDVGEGRRSRLSRPSPGSRGLLRASSVIAAVAAVLVILLGIQVSHLDTKVDNLSALSERQGISRAVQAALLDPNARRITLAGSSNAAPMLAELVLLPSGSAYLINSGLAPLPSDETYQLWGVFGNRAISLGLLGNRPVTVPLTLGTGATVTAFAVTAERAGGVVISSHTPVAKSASLTA